MGVLLTREVPLGIGVSQTFFSREIGNLQQGGSKFPPRAFYVALGLKFQTLQAFLSQKRGKVLLIVAYSQNLPRRYSNL